MIKAIHRTAAVYSIQCCTGDDNTCSSKPVDCPSNICFKLGKIWFISFICNYFLIVVIGKLTEERGCLDDLIKLLNFSNKGRTITDGNSLTSESSDDQCHRLGTYGNGMSLCKCTSDLCNSSSKLIYLTKPILTFIILFLQYFLRVFLS